MLRALCFLTVAAVLSWSDIARAMCGCMLPPRPPPKQGVVSNAKIVNKTSKVVLARDGDRTTMTLANDFVGAPAEFGLVVPVPTVITKKDVQIVDDKLFVELETATAPKLVETEDPDPCAAPVDIGRAAPSAAAEKVADAAPRKPALRASDYGVKVESHFFAGEYEIAVLSGTDSDKLVAWLQKLNYDVPDNAAAVLGSYIKQKMKFFVARVYVKEMGNKPRFLRPIQVSYTTPKLMLPIRLGMVNADGPQELLVFAWSQKGRIEPTNYRTMKLPTGQGELPAFVKDEFDKVYSAAFEQATKREDMRVVFIESALPVTSEGAAAFNPWAGGERPASERVPATEIARKGGILEGGVVTRLHFKYDEERFPEDLVLQETTDRALHVSRFTSRKHQLGPARCEQHKAYLRALPPQLDRQAQVLANLTGWNIEEIRAKQPKPTP